MNATRGTNIAEAAASGIVIGAILGGLTGLLTGGLASGMVESIVFGIFAGTIGGGVIGVLIGLSLPKEEINANHYPDLIYYLDVKPSHEEYNSQEKQRKIALSLKKKIQKLFN